MENKYDVVKRDIKEKILSGHYSINDRLPTEASLMEQYGVSRYTIRRAIGDLETDHYVYRIQGGGMFVDDWQKYINKPIEGKMIGVISTRIADYIFPNIITGIDRYVSAEGYSILISNTQNDPQKERKGIKKMMEIGLSGLIIEPTQSALGNPNRDLYDKLKETGLPTVFINAHYPELDFPYLEVNDYEAERQVTNKLIGMGHEKILGIFKIDDTQGVHRMKGYISAYQEHRDLVMLSEMVMYQSSDNMHNVFTRIESILARPDRPTAIICYHDQIAIRVIDLVRSMGLKIPEDISIFGFDNYKLAKYISPKLSTVEHPKETMGRDAAKTIFDIIEGRPYEKNKVYDPELIIRESIKKI
ncbi:GntR family transcriptional regulator [Pediococcus pentosaceus]|uniref:GntR family transcriptional regulator n=1 Tax=Pediococcus pentosaceus TaxID=1255 RepID=UPI002073F07E|nr:GntR family transcriptional regulator [Pediococcus pentosaceus]MCM6811022.1 GntR family transcriptional regulator [Pediococcus pentosaceus]